MSDFDLRQLEVFCRILELQSFSRAAEAVNLSPASVSERMATLEQQVGARLLDRGGGPVRATAAGELLYRHAQKLLRLKRRACEELDDLLGLRRGELLLGGSTIPGDYLLPRIVARFRKDHPGVVVHLTIADSARITSLVSEGAVELGVVGARATASDLAVVPLWHDELLLCMRRDHRWAGRPRISLAEVAAEPFIAREPGSGTRRLLEERLAEVQGPSLGTFNLAAELGSSTAILHGLLSGLGVAVISRRAVEESALAGTLTMAAIDGITLTRSFYLIYNKRRTRSPAARAMEDILRADGQGSLGESSKTI